MAHAGPVTGRTSEDMELVCEAVGDDHIRQVTLEMLRRKCSRKIRRRKALFFAIH